MHLVPPIAGKQRDRCEKTGAVHRREYVVLGSQPLSPCFPVVTKIEFIGGERRRHQLENGECHAAGIDLLKYLAYGFARRVLGQFDGGNLELLEAQPDLIAKSLHEQHRFCSEPIMCAEAAFPGHETLDVEEQCHGEEPLAVLQIRRADIQINPATEVRGDL